MGVLQDVLDPVSQQFSKLGLGSQIGAVLVGSLVMIVLVNVLKQKFFANPNEPPVVFHYFPVIGSTITYGMDPPTFFKVNRAKVRDARLSLLPLEAVFLN